MKKTVYDFTPPAIMGALGDSSMKPSYATAFERNLKKRPETATCLPLQVKKRYLKNVVECMKLMDIVGLAIHPSYQKAIMKHLPSIEKCAKDAGFVDVVVRKNKRFVGMNARMRAEEQSSSRSPKQIEALQRAIALDLIFG